MLLRWSIALFSVALLVGCPGTSSNDAGSPATDGGQSATDGGGGDPPTDGGDGDGDGGGAPDGGDGDGDLDGGSGDQDAGTDAGAPDGPLPGFGVISGDCQVLDDELTSPEPSFFVGAIDFGDDPFDIGVDDDQLTAGGLALLNAGNLNPGSLLSEVFAYEVLARCEDAVFLKGEDDVSYDPVGKKTDFLAEIDGLKIGVSVTRAIDFPFDDPYTVPAATELLNDKLSDILLSSSRVTPEDAWVKQILHVIAYAPGHVEALQTAWESLDAAVRADTILYITVTNGDDSPLYPN